MLDKVTYKGLLKNLTLARKEMTIEQYDQAFKRAKEIWNDNSMTREQLTVIATYLLELN